MLTAEALVRNHPLIYHMSEPSSWPSIRKHGLLSATALLDLFEYKGEPRYKIEFFRRPDWVTLNTLLTITSIRDQWPSSNGGLRKALPGDMSPVCWYKVLNGMIFSSTARKDLKG